MKSTPILSTLAEEHSYNETHEPNRFEVLKQLEKITSSTHFRNSKRYPTLLKFVVEHTLAGRTDVLKERTLGAEVFGRPSDYDTNADPIVRVTAGEIRKRIAQYYRSPGCERELRIELPLGSYVPQFFPAEAAPAKASLEPVLVPDREIVRPSLEPVTPIFAEEVAPAAPYPERRRSSEPGIFSSR